MNKYIYYVEGEDEQKIVDTLKSKGNEYIISGKAIVFNMARDEIKKSQLMSLNKSAVVVIIVDNDLFFGNFSNPEIHRQRILKNISLLKKYCKDIVVIIQKENLEDEIIKATSIKKIEELLNSLSKSEWKSDLIKEKNLMKKLLNKKFDFDKFWKADLPKFIKNIKTSDEIRLK